MPLENDFSPRLRAILHSAGCSALDDAFKQCNFTTCISVNNFDNCAELTASIEEAIEAQLGEEHKSAVQQIFAYTEAICRQSVRTTCLDVALPGPIAPRWSKALPPLPQARKVKPGLHATIGNIVTMQQESEAEEVRKLSARL